MDREIHVKRGEEISPDTTEIRRPTCRGCRLACLIKKELIKQDPEVRCVVPKAREQALQYGHPVIDENILKGIGARVLKRMYASASARGTKDQKALLEAVIKFKEAFYPSVQKTANLNIETNLAEDIVRDLLGDVKR